MRTKTKLLSALFGIAGSLSLMAQSTNVYSLNAVGYINLSLPPGFSMIACQLYEANGNALSNVFNNVAGGYNDVLIYKWTGSTYANDSGDPFDTTGNGSYWSSGGQLTINPGEAVWFYNQDSTNILTTLVGTVPQGSLTNTTLKSSGFNMVSSIVPQGGDLCTNLNMTNAGAGDIVFVFNNYGTTSTSNGYVVYQVDNFGSGNGTSSSSYLSEWDAPSGPAPYPSNGDPQVSIAQGFWYSVAGGNPTPSWVRSFSVNQ